MAEATPLDMAHAAMEAAPDDAAARLRFYDRLAASELYLLLTADPDGDRIAPEIFDLSDSRFVLVFDREERLTAFTGRAVPYAALSGRSIVEMLAGAEIGLAVNPEVAPSSILLPPDAVDWLQETLEHGPSEAQARIAEVRSPGALPEALLRALDARLATATGLARSAWLAEATYDDGARGHLLGIAGAVPGAEDALARAVNEALVFSGIDAGALDLVFLRDSDPVTARLARVGLRFDLPELPQQDVRSPAAPGMDPDRPPKLK